MHPKYEVGNLKVIADSDGEISEVFKIIINDKDNLALQSTLTNIGIKPQVITAFAMVILSSINLFFIQNIWSVLILIITVLSAIFLYRFVPKNTVKFKITDSQ